MKVFVHIGLEKTGSTSIERTCARNDARLAAQGIRYLPRTPVKGRRFAANHAFAWALSGRPDIDNADRIVGDAAAFIARARDPVLISSEMFAKFEPEPIARLGEMLADRDVEVIVYLRNQIDWVEAMLNQKVKSSRSVEVGRWFKDYLPRLDYLATCDRWAEVFGASAIHARRYDGKPDILADFFALIGVGNPGKLVLPQNPVNPSLAAIPYDMKRIANTFGNSREFRGALTRIQMAAGWRDKPRILSGRQERQVREIAAATNPRVWERYIRDGSAPFELPDRSDSAPTIEDEALAAVVAGIWLEQERTIADLKARVKALERVPWRWPWRHRSR